MADEEQQPKVKRVRTKRRTDDLHGEFTIVAVPGTHRDQTKRRYGRHEQKNARLKKADKQKILLEARRDGASWREAAKRAGYRSMSGAYVAAQEAIADIPVEAANEARTIEMQRLDEVIAGMLPLARIGDAHAAMAVVKASERRARLLGLDLAEPDQNARIDVQLQRLVVELIAQAPEEFERTEAEMRLLTDASQRGTDRESGAAGAFASGD